MSSDQGRASPHDALFRRVLGEPEHAASELRSVLPAEVSAQLDLDRLILVPGSFVDEELRWRHCDLLFSTRTRTGRPALVYVLMEHQSSVDRWMVVRMWRYVSRIWDRHCVAHPAGDGLPLVIPVVVYHGRAPWRAATELAGMLDLDPAAAAGLGAAGLVPGFRFLLDDLSGVDEQGLRARQLTASARVTLLLLMRAAANPDLPAELMRWVPDLRAVVGRPDGTATLVAFVAYISRVADLSVESLLPVMRDVGPDAEEAYVTIADQFHAEGRVEGRVEGRAEALLQVLELRFGPLPPAVVDAAGAAPVEQLTVWMAQAITATTIDEALR